MMISGNDYVRYITEQVTVFLNKTTEERREEKQQRKSFKKQFPNYTDKWFGILPLALKLLMKKD